MTNVKNTSTSTKKYTFKGRTARFGEHIIKFAMSLPNNPINRSLIQQLVRSGTSIGANYMEADGAESKRDFNHKIGICKKEAKETMYWLRILAKANPGKVDASRKL